MRVVEYSYTEKAGKKVRKARYAVTSKGGMIRFVKATWGDKVTISASWQRAQASWWLCH